MTKELINTIKVHAWKKSELKEIIEFCISSIIEDDYINVEVKNG